MAQFSHIDLRARPTNPRPHHRRPGGSAPTSRTGAASAVVASAGSAAPVAALTRPWCAGTANAHAQRNRPCTRYRNRPCCPLLQRRLPASVRQPTAPMAGALAATLAVVTVSVTVITHLVLSPVVLTVKTGRHAREVMEALLSNPLRNTMVAL